MCQSALAGSLRKGAVHNLIDGVDRFPFTRTATEHEDARDEVELRIAGFVLAVILAVLAKNDTWNAHRLSAMTTQDTAKLLRGGFCRHKHRSFDKFTKAEEDGAYKMAGEFVYREDSKGQRK